MSPAWPDTEVAEGFGPVGWPDEHAMGSSLRSPRLPLIQSKYSLSTEHRDEDSVLHFACGHLGCVGTLVAGSLPSGHTEDLGRSSASEWAIPVAGLNVRPTHITEKEYYSLPLENLRTHPVYFPSAEPEGWGMEPAGPSDPCDHGLEFGLSLTVREWEQLIAFLRTL